MFNVLRCSFVETKRRSTLLRSSSNSHGTWQMASRFKNEKQEKGEEDEEAAEEELKEKQ